MAHLSEIHIYPIKSIAGRSLEAAEVLPRGLAHDRRWMLVDANGKFLTAREHGALLRVHAEPDETGIALHAPGLPDLRVAAPAKGERLPVQVWKDHLEALAAGAEADAWFSRYLGFEARLVFMGPDVHRPKDTKHAREGDEVSFADSMPLLVTSQAALDALNERLDRPVPMARFRPNLVVDDLPAHDEDSWRQVQVGEVLFDVAKPCTRCVLVNTDPATGERDPAHEPLRTLSKYRRADDGVRFGQLLIPRSEGTVRVGDAVRVLARH